MVLVSMKLSDFIKLEEGQAELKSLPYHVNACDFYRPTKSEYRTREVYELGREFGLKAAIEGLTYFKFL